MNCKKKLLCILAYSLSVAINAQTINIHSISYNRQSAGDNGYTLDGSFFLASFRAQLLDPAEFSSVGTYKKDVQITDAYSSSGSISQVSSLSYDNIFFFGSFDKNHASTQKFTSTEIDTLYNWSKRGGKLIIAGAGYYAPNNSDISILDYKWGYSFMQQSAGTNPIPINPTTMGASTDIFNGPFGKVTYANQGLGLQGYFKTIPANSVVLGTDDYNNPTLFMDCNTLDLVVADVDAFNDHIILAPDQRVFRKNVIAFMDKLQQPPVIANLSGSLSSNNSNYNNYQWYYNNNPINGEVSSQYLAQNSGSYYLEVEVNGGCKVKSNIIIIGENIHCENLDSLIIPNAFTPNSDNINDFFKIEGLQKECIESFKIEIYNRWGESVFNSNMMDFNWDGIKNGTALSAGVYSYVVEIGYKNNTISSYKSGNITLLR